MVDPVRNHQGPGEEGRPLAPMTMQAMRGGGDIYDMAAYVKHAGGGGEGGRRPGYRGRPRVRPGLDGYRRMDSMEEVEGLEAGEERPAIPLRSELGLATIDRRYQQSKPLHFLLFSFQARSSNVPPPGPWTLGCREPGSFPAYPGNATNACFRASAAGSTRTPGPSGTSETSRISRTSWTSGTSGTSRTSRTSGTPRT